MNRFWLVWNPQGNNPSHRHTNYLSAKIEVERLAGEYHNHAFYVLECVGKAEAVKPIRYPVSFTVADSGF